MVDCVGVFGWGEERERENVRVGGMNPPPPPSSRGKTGSARVAKAKAYPLQQHVGDREHLHARAQLAPHEEQAGERWAVRG